MTETSKIMAKKAVSIRSTAEATAYLLSHPPFRTIKDILMAAAGQGMTEKELKSMLTEGMLRHHPDQNRDSIQRKIGNWLNGKTRTLTRDTAFELCLILGLSLEQANICMMRLTDEAIHWRNPEEIAWAYAIAHRLDYAGTLKLVAAARRAAEGATPRTDVYTHMIREKVIEQLRGTQEQLLDFIAQNRAQWGQYHNQAHALFQAYYNRLKTDETQDREAYESLNNERKLTGESNETMKRTLSAEDILNTYFFRSCVKGKAKSALQKSIKANWPDEAVLSKMRNRAEDTDVSRKVLMMLFLATYEGEDPEEDEDIDERERREKAFKRIYKGINTMLSRCGFQILDPRSPFDWIVLHCISRDDTCEMDMRMGEILTDLFAEETPNETPDDGKEK